MNQSINTDSKNSKEPQQKYRLGTVSIKILGGLLGLYIWSRKPFQPTYHCLVGELTPEYLKGLILGTPQVGEGAQNPLLGLYGIKEREESNKDPGRNVSGRESGLYIWPRKPFQPTYYCLVGEMTPEYLKGLILGTPRVGNGARNPLLGLYGIKEREESNKDPGENVSGKERIRERIRTIYMATKAIPTYLPLPRGGVDPRRS